ncbi:MAG: serine hydrolase, partial [Prevotellaceae bacterium]|nr:serine hydrolase [Prevotellaceae bacterium]
LRALLAGNDVLVFPTNVSGCIDTIALAVGSGQFPAELLDEKCLRVLKVKYWAGLSSKVKPFTSSGSAHLLNSPSMKQLRVQITEASMTIASDKNSFLPIKRLDTLRIAYLEVSKNNKANTFYHTARSYTALTKYTIDPSKTDYSQLTAKLQGYNLIIVGYMEINQRLPQHNFSLDSTFCKWLTQLAASKRTVLTLYANPYVMPKVGDYRLFESVLLAYSSSPEAQQAAAQALFGGIPVTGKSAVTVPQFIATGEGVQRERTRLKYGTPEELYIAPERLTAIDSLVQHAIEAHAFPGCQVLAAHKGVVFYQKAFGHHTYEQETSVSLSHIYDVASVTKMAATLPVIMKMVEDKSIHLNDPLGKHITLKAHSNKSSLALRDILLHQSGLKAWIPVAVPFLQSTFPEQALISAEQSESYPFKLYANTYLNKFHSLAPEVFTSTDSLPDYPYAVAHDIYAHRSIREKVYQQIDDTELQDKRYRYSDLGFYYLQRLIEEKTGSSLAHMADSLFYKPLGMASTGYLPLQKFNLNQIAPTEWEYPFRRQLIHGYVHDQGAATVGGVAGHAGLFSTANDLAKLMQMFLWHGSYGGVQLLKPETVNEFTKAHAKGNRRGLGFDKPEPNPHKASPVCKEASLEGYGHSGFTGTFVWVDPQRELVYVFLSNRVHPDANNALITTLNLRSNILRELINAIDNK